MEFTCSPKPFCLSFLSLSPSYFFRFNFGGKGGEKRFLFSLPLSSLIWILQLSYAWFPRENSGKQILILYIWSPLLIFWEFLPFPFYFAWFMGFGIWINLSDPTETNQYHPLCDGTTQAMFLMPLVLRSLCSTHWQVCVELKILQFSPGLRRDLHQEFLYVNFHSATTNVQFTDMKTQYIGFHLSSLLNQDISKNSKPRVLPVKFLSLFNHFSFLYCSFLVDLWRQRTRHPYILSSNKGKRKRKMKNPHFCFIPPITTTVQYEGAASRTRPYFENKSPYSATNRKFSSIRRLHLPFVGSNSM